YGNLATSFAGPVSAGLASGAGSLSGTTTVTAQSGVATFDNLLATTSGTISLNVGSGTLTPVTSDPIEVSAAPATQLVVTTPPPSSLTLGQSFDLGVSAEDQFGHVDRNFTGSVTISLPSESVLI